MEDDEVQFVISVPRRRKRRRRRLEPSPNDTQTPMAPINALPPRNTKSISLPHGARPRRGTTGMTDGPEYDRIGREVQLSKRSGSLPAISLHSTNAPIPNRPQLKVADIIAAVEEPEPFTDFPDSMDWWTDQIPSIQNGNPLQYGWNFFPIDSSIAKKRKRTDDTISIELPPNSLSGSLRRTSTLSRSFELPQTAAFCSPSDTEVRMSNTWGDMGCDKTTLTSPAPYPNQNITTANLETICPKLIDSTISSLPLPASMGICSKLPIPQNTTECISLPKQQPISHFISPRPVVQIPENNVSIQVPASLALDQSVSPRTKTVEISRPRISAQYQSPYSATQADNYKQAATLLPDANKTTHAYQPRQRYAEFPSVILPSQATENVRPAAQPSVPDPYDIFRKPSLYKVPAWPAHIQSSNPVTGAPNITSYGKASNHSGNMCSATSPSRLQSPVHAGRTREVPLSAPQQTSQMTPSPSMTSSATPSKHGKKHAPNLVVDIAETCQANFPFAVVAARHNVAIQKVFDTYSAIIQLPLLRHAADNRRHGSLGKRRLKEFREARKAMEKATKEEHKKQGANGKDVSRERMANQK